MSMTITSVSTVALVQSSLYGSPTGNRFNDIETVGNYPDTLSIDVDHPIKQIVVVHGAVIDGLRIKYKRTTDTQHVDHGSAPDAQETDKSLKVDKIDFKDHENIIAITGQAGTVSPFGQRVVSLSFVTFNSDNGAIKQYGPYGNSEGHQLEWFRVTANGSFVAFGGTADNSDASVGALTTNNGLYGLTFTEIEYRKV